jgi:hypothetical protein
MEIMEIIHPSLLHCVYCTPHPVEIKECRHKPRFMSCSCPAVSQHLTYLIISNLLEAKTPLGVLILQDDNGCFQVQICKPSEIRNQKKATKLISKSCNRQLPTKMKTPLSQNLIQRPNATWWTISQILGATPYSRHGSALGAKRPGAMNLWSSNNIVHFTILKIDSKRTRFKSRDSCVTPETLYYIVLQEHRLVPIFIGATFWSHERLQLGFKVSIPHLVIYWWQIRISGRFPKY